MAPLKQPKQTPDWIEQFGENYQAISPEQFMPDPLLNQPIPEWQISPEVQRLLAEKQARSTQWYRPVTQFFDEVSASQNNPFNRPVYEEPRARPLSRKEQQEAYEKSLEELNRWQNDKFWAELKQRRSLSAFPGMDEKTMEVGSTSKEKKAEAKSATKISPVELPYVRELLPGGIRFTDDTGKTTTNQVVRIEPGKESQTFIKKNGMLSPVKQGQNIPKIPEMTGKNIREYFANRGAMIAQTEQANIPALRQVANVAASRSPAKRKESSASRMARMESLWAQHLLDNPDLAQTYSSLKKSASDIGVAERGVGVLEKRAETEAEAEKAKAEYNQAMYGLEGEKVDNFRRSFELESADKRAERENKIHLAMLENAGRALQFGNESLASHIQSHAKAMAEIAKGDLKMAVEAVMQDATNGFKEYLAKLPTDKQETEKMRDVRYIITHILSDPARRFKYMEAVNKGHNPYELLARLQDAEARSPK